MIIKFIKKFLAKFIILFFVTLFAFPALADGDSNSDARDGRIFTNFNYGGQTAYCYTGGDKVKEDKCDGSAGQTVYLLKEEGKKTATGLINTYFGYFISFLIKFGVLAGIGAIVVGGIMMSVSGDSEENKGKDVLITGIVVVCIIVFSGVILNSINPLFFVW